MTSMYTASFVFGVTGGQNLKILCNERVRWKRFWDPLFQQGKSSRLLIVSLLSRTYFWWKTNSCNACTPAL